MNKIVAYPTKNKAVNAYMWMEYYDFKVFTCVLWRFTTKFAPLTRVFRCVTYINRDNTTESGWIHLKVGIQCALFLVKYGYANSLRLGRPWVLTLACGIPLTPGLAAISQFKVSISDKEVLHKITYSLTFRDQMIISIG